MNQENKFLDNVGKVFGDALGVVGNFKTEFDNLTRHKIEDCISKLDYVKREEFEVLKEMLVQIRISQQQIEEKLKKLEDE